MVPRQVFKVLDRSTGPADRGTERSRVPPKTKEEFLRVLCRVTEPSLGIPINS
jgi:hypothetical protein